MSPMALAIFRLSVVLAFTLFPTLALAQDVGIIKGRYGCPAGSSEVRIHLDNEDKNEESSVHGWVGATQRDGNGNINYRFCRVPGAQFLSAAGDFALLLLGSKCPNGAEVFLRFFDNEDRNNANSAHPSLAAIAPNDLSSADYDGNLSNSTLFFCRYSEGMGSFPNLGVEYGVFGNAQNVPNGLEFGWVFNDDEDKWPHINWNSYRFEGLTFWDETRHSRFPNIIDGEQNTTLHMARVTSNPVPTRPVASCSVSPSYAVDWVQAEFADSGSYARGGRVIASYFWTFDDGSTAEGPGPHGQYYSAPYGSTQYFGAVLTVTDDHGESATAYCGVTVTSSACSSELPCTS